MYPGVDIEQLKVAHPGSDDDGIWYIRHPSTRVEVQIESSKGVVPFLVESSQDSSCATGRTVEETVALVAKQLGLAARTA
jgi:hypothetical protein